MSTGSAAPAAAQRLPAWRRRAAAAGGAVAAVTALIAAACGGAEPEDTLTLYCSAPEEWCQLMATAFTRATGTRVAMTRRSAGETYAQLRAESANPRADVWWGGTGDPHLVAAEQELTEPYESPLLAELHDWALGQHRASGGRSVGVYAGALGFGYNTELLARRGLAAPACWADLVRPEYRGEVQMAHPASSGTAYTALATLVQLLGEAEAFAYLGALHRNVNQYTRSGAAPIAAAARGETLVGIVFQHDAVTQRLAGFPIRVVSPCEGTGYEVGSMSVVRGARNAAAARRFYDFALGAEVQSLAPGVGAYQVPSNRGASVSAESPDLATLTLIDYDFRVYGAAETRQRLLDRWEREIAAGPR